MDKIIPNYKVEIKNADYSSIESAVDKHNSSAKPGEKYWGISMDNGYYIVYEYGEVPEPTPEPEPVEPTIDEVRQSKLDEISSICEQVIYGGVDVELSTGKKHFSLTANDQTNIDSVFNAIVLGATEYPYHADGEPCEMYSASDVMTLYIAAKGFVTQQTTYCNALRQWIKREDKIETISAIRYGDTLPSDLQKNVENILTAANAQVQAIARKLTTAISN
nr:MAG TPA: protein of unknown function (DUF4376) [Caudoviricetes sp.]